MRLFLYILWIPLLLSCDRREELLTAQDIVDKAIETSCNGNCDKASVEFMFRGRRYVRTREKRSFEYQRITTTDSGIITDVLTNKGFQRFINDTLIRIPDSMAVKYSNSVNSVHYFSQLPFGLNDNAVNKKLLETDTIKSEAYYKIEVTFDEEGGGKDFEDVFIFWVHQMDFTVDYLAYEFFTDGGGMRFREAINDRLVNGIRFVNYNNFKPKTKNVVLRDLNMLFTEDQLVLLSKIETEDIKVKMIKESSVDGQ